jgi:hypothetical protein
MKKIYTLFLTITGISLLNAQSLDLTFNGAGHNSLTVTTSVHSGQRAARR